MVCILKNSIYVLKNIIYTIKMLNPDNIIWSKGPIRNYYSTLHTEYSSSEADIIELIKSAKDKLFIRSSSKSNGTDINYFASNINYLNNDIILITSDGDISIPSSLNNDVVNTILNCNKIKKWFTQNYDKTIIHEKFKNIPIGFDLHTPSLQIGRNVQDKIKFMLKLRNNVKILDKIFSDTHCNISHYERGKLYKVLRNNSHIVFSKERVNICNITKQYSTYKFVLSPRGNGLDCHRTWELFLLGVIVITKSSPLDSMFIDNNLPVVILESWDELNENLDFKLKVWLETYEDRTNLDNILPKLTFNYWLNNKININ